VTPSDQRRVLVERYAWLAGVAFVLFLLGESVVAVGVPLDQNDSAAKIARELNDHRTRLTVIACLSVVYTVAFGCYLWKLHDLLRSRAPAALRSLAAVALGGGALFVALHATSDIGITGLLGAKVAAYSAAHDPGLSYTLYLLTFAIDSVGDVFGSLFALATGWLVLRTGLLPRWLGWAVLLVGLLFIVQAFGLGGVIATFGLVTDLIGFVLLLVFVAVSSVMLARRPEPAA
jgi:hypothetical protein